jgi:hypothetical protein
MLTAARRIPEALETRFDESPNAARLFRRISELDTEGIDELLKVLEERKRNNGP